MERRSTFCPEAVSPLEARLVLHHGGTSHVVSVVVSGLNPQSQVLNSKQTTVAAELNQAFNSFTTDYDQARSHLLRVDRRCLKPRIGDHIGLPTVYQAAGLSALPANHQQLSPVAQRNVAHYGEPSVLKTLISQKIINTTGKDPQGSLADSLLVNIPPPGTSARPPRSTP